MQPDKKQAAAEFEQAYKKLAEREFEAVTIWGEPASFPPHIAAPLRAMRRAVAELAGPAGMKYLFEEPGQTGAELRRGWLQQKVDRRLAELDTTPSGNLRRADTYGYRWRQITGGLWYPSTPWDKLDTGAGRPVRPRPIYRHRTGLFE